MTNQTDIIDILLVEDNPRDAELTIRSLKKRNMANQLLWVEDGALALDFLFARGQYAGRDNLPQPKVILLDLKLPKVDGFQVLKEVKGNPRTIMLPVVIMTSSREDPDIKAAFNNGANSYIVKPVDFNNFTEVMSQIGFYWLFINQAPI